MIASDRRVLSAVCMPFHHVGRILARASCDPRVNIGTGPRDRTSLTCFRGRRLPNRPARRRLWGDRPESNRNREVHNLALYH